MDVNNTANGVVCRYSDIQPMYTADVLCGEGLLHIKGQYWSVSSLAIFKEFITKKLVIFMLSFYLFSMWSFGTFLQTTSFTLMCANQLYTPDWTVSLLVLLINLCVPRFYVAVIVGACSSRGGLPAALSSTSHCVFDVLHYRLIRLVESTVLPASLLDQFWYYWI